MNDGLINGGVLRYRVLLRVTGVDLESRELGFPTVICGKIPLYHIDRIEE